MPDDIRTLTIPPELAGERLDKALAALVPDLSRARLQALMAAGQLAGESGEDISDASRKVHAGDSFRLTVPPPVPAEPEAQEIALDIVYEDDDLLVIDKPAGLVVHPAAGNPDGTLVNALLAHCGDSLSGIGGTLRPGIVHRIDKDTSGLLVAAKSERAHQGLAAQFAEHAIERVYTAFAWGVPRPARGRIEGAIGRSATHRRKMAIVTRGGKPAVTDYETIAAYGGMAARLACRLETGRTHQIRVHLASRSHPLIGDPLYGKGRRALRRDVPPALPAAIEALPGQALHAGILGFTHPVSGEALRFESELPPPLKALAEALEAL
jgi:23S rRNA pseudouridine1911/1915/1917 synthase